MPQINIDNPLPHNEASNDDTTIPKVFGKVPNLAVDHQAVVVPEVAEAQTYATAEEASTKTRDTSRRHGRKVTPRLIIEAALVLTVIGFGAWNVSLQSTKKQVQQQLATLNANPQLVAQRQAADLIDKVSHLMVLPTDEAPTIASVTDVAQAQAQSQFFANAELGDKVLLYVKTGNAILYRPSADRIIATGPLSFKGK